MPFKRRGDPLCEKAPAGVHYNEHLEGDGAAITAAADADHLVSNTEFAERLRGLGTEKCYELARGYRLLKRFPSAIRVAVDDFQPWLTRRDAS